ncbi:hypothetical protein BO82DRAFT_354091 [Aspergillus uvarum CBS 121591]|uniref:Uncharacterized protein n=1 Tax=Aspergillus uvarum CBS 121591 TaxID=1448315 RepID=A0A319CET4_9EURO|nr:hypothetical protein BO82DRAFT_354091 [Aspergillus uvarum CBS 121591]PYH82211.1 hypothetical protein BO82DRAFT_354091 [Aspergillus uvarum CBS 121591]
MGGGRQLGREVVFGVEDAAGWDILIASVEKCLTQVWEMVVSGWSWIGHGGVVFSKS